VCALAVCARRTTLKSEALLFSDGVQHHQSRRHGLVCRSLLGWFDLLLTRCLHVSPLAMALHVVRVYVMCVCRGNMWAVKSLMKERAR